MDILIFAIGVILCLVGIIGSFLPVIPGPITSWFGLLILNLTDAVPFNLKFLLITLSVAILVFLLDFITPIYGVKKLGGSYGGQIGASLGLLIGIFIIGPLGIFIGPIIGAITGEMINNKGLKKSLKPAFGSILGTLTGIVLKFCLSMTYFVFFLNIFWQYRENFF